ncbi:hypothetical protein C8F01DRAFT_637375 [Mycena amicta]|nr:hypothetical protein C8F01DRAFT_637375 [Mycena amicta]
MSSFLSYGFLPLAGGTCVAMPNGTTYHGHYTTAIRTARRTYLPAKLRVYSGSSSIPLPDNTVAFTVAKVFAPAGHDAIIELEALHMNAIPGDPNSPTYQDAIPDCATIFTGVGNVPATIQVPAGWKAFNLAMDEFIYNSHRQFSIMCVFPATARWRNTHPPQPLSCTEVTGVCDSRTADGTFQLSIDNIALNLGPTSATRVTTTPTTIPSTPSSLKYQLATPSASTEPVASTSRTPMYPITSLSIPTPSAPYTPTPKGKGSKKRVAVVSPQPSESHDEEEEDTEPEQPMGRGKRNKKAKKQ